MSIIHEALKKAASEGTHETARNASASHLFRASVQTPHTYSWIIGIVLFFISSILVYTRYLPSQSGNFNSTAISPTSPSLNPKVTVESPHLDQAPVIDKQKVDPANTGVLQPSRVEEGERALVAGIEFYHDGKIEDANKTLTKAIELLPLSPIAHNNLGMVLRHQGKTTEAIKHYQEAIRLDSNYAEAENNIGLIYDKTGSIDQAAMHYKRAIEIKPAVAVFHLNYATLLERKGDFLNARKEYQIYLDLETDQKSEVIPLVRSHLGKLKGF